MTDTQIDLQPFCSKDEERTGLLKPFSDDHYTYASDGIIMIRVYRVEGYGESSLLNQSAKIFTEVLRSGERVIPPMTEIPTMKCKLCKGRCTVRKCEACNGEGERLCDMQHMHDCEKCNSKGYRAGGDLDCWECDGSGSRVDITYVYVGARKFNASMLNRIAVLPGVLMTTEGDPFSPSYFIFDGGDGVIAPCK